MPKMHANGVEIEYDEAGAKDGIPFLMINGFGSQIFTLDYESFRTEQKSFELLAGYINGSTVNVTVDPPTSDPPPSAPSPTAPAPSD